MKYRVLGLALALLATAAGCSGGQQNSSSSTTTQTQASSEPTVAAATASAKTSANTAGQTVYNANCSTCHQATGTGSQGAFPPLAHNGVVTGDPQKVIHIVKDGLQGRIQVNGKSYNGVMPSWKSSLSNSQIAAVVTYIRSSWGNHGSAVNEKQVAAVK